MPGQQRDGSPSAMAGTQEGAGLGAAGVQSYGPYRQRKRVPIVIFEVVVRS